MRCVQINAHVSLSLQGQVTPGRGDTVLAPPGVPIPCNSMLLRNFDSICDSIYTTVQQLLLLYLALPGVIVISPKPPK